MPDVENWFNEGKKRRAPPPPPPPQPVVKNNLRKHVRFRVDDASAMMYVRGFMSSLGLGRNNLAKQLMNLSEGGVMLRLQEKVPRGEKVRVRLKMEKYDDEFEGDGVVRWCVPHPKKADEFYVGVQFEDLKEEQAKKLIKMRDWFTSPEYKAKAGARAKGTIDFLGS
jgi:Tfp pilus assembly protein PilZ